MKILQNKLKRFRKTLKKRSKVVARWRKEKVAAALSLIKTCTSKVRKLPSIIMAGLILIFFENHYGVRLIKRWVSVLGYLLIIIIGCIVVILLDLQDGTRQIIHNPGANEAIIGVASVLLALLIPLAIALIEDAKESPLARQTIVKSIIRFNLAPFNLLFICLFLFIPSGIVVFGESVTVRSLYAAVIAACVAFILMSFYRSYKWLSDGSLYSSGSSKTPPPDQPQPEAFFSYRFARIVQLLYGAKSYETWIMIWSQWFPVEYEDVLHTAFFKRENNIIERHQTKKYIILSVELEAYNKYYDRRNKDSWRFQMDYIGQFLVLYAKLSKIIESDRKTARIEGLWRGERALESINEKLITSSLNRNDAWDLFQAIEKYVLEGDFIEIGDRKRLHSSKILKYFLQQYFEAVFTRDFDVYSMQNYFAEHKEWLITYDNLYVNRYNISFVVAEEFKEWLFKKLDDPKEDGGMYGIDALLGNLFPEADPIAMADLFWLLYKGRHNTDSGEIIEMVKQPRSFGHMGRTMTAEWVDDENQRMTDFVTFNNEQEDNAVKLFATMHARYFRGFWKLDGLIEVAKARIESTEDEREKARLEPLVRRLQKVEAFYASVDKEQAKSKKTKKKK